MILQTFRHLVSIAEDKKLEIKVYFYAFLFVYGVFLLLGN